MKVDGKALQLRLAGATIALATDCSIEDSLELIDARVKEDVGTYNEPGEITTTISSESLLGVNAGTVQHTYAKLRSMMRARQLVDVEFFLAANAWEALALQDWVRGPERTKGFEAVSGRAYIRSLRLAGGVQGKAAISVQLTVQGELESMAPPVLAASVVGNTLMLGGTAEVRRGVLYVDSVRTSVDGNTLVVEEVEPVNE